MELTTKTAGALVASAPRFKETKTMKMEILRATIINGLGAVEPGEVHEVKDASDQQALLASGKAREYVKPKAEKKEAPPPPPTKKTVAKKA